MGDYLECPLCLDFFTRVIETNCCHRCYCYECLRKWVSTKNTCPSCRSSVSDVNSCRPNIPFQRLVDELPAKCTFASDGCTDKVTRGILAEHVKNCAFSPTQCDFGKENCPKLRKKDLAQHKNECSYRIVKCNLCVKDIVWMNMEAHQTSECDFTEISCTANCGAKFPRTQMKDHKKICPLEDVGCPLKRIGCSFRSKRKDVDEHLKEKAVDHLNLALKHIEALEGQKDKLLNTITEQTMEIENMNYGMKQLSALKPKLPHCHLNQVPLIFPTFLKDGVHSSIVTVSGCNVTSKPRASFRFSFGTSTSSIQEENNNAIIPGDLVIPNFSRFTSLPYYFELNFVKLAPGCNVGIGLVDKAHDMKGVLGSSGISYGYFPITSTIIGYPDKNAKPYGIPFPTEQRVVVGCGLDMKNGVIFFTLNEYTTGVAFKNVSGYFFPAVFLDTPSTEISVNFGQFKFAYNSKHWQDDYEMWKKFEICKANGICTYAVTGKGYAPQIMYNCATCKLVDNFGMCFVCATTCHSGHNVTRGNFSGGFFCDCGHQAVEEKSRKCVAAEKIGLYKKLIAESESQEKVVKNNVSN